MALPEIASIILRLAELAFAAVVAGLNGDYLHSVRGASSWDLGRHIYTEVVAGLSILFAIIWLFPFSSSFIHWPADLFFSILWFVAFGLLVDWLDGSCGYVSLLRLVSTSPRPKWIKANFSSDGFSTGPTSPSGTLHPVPSSRP